MAKNRNRNKPRGGSQLFERAQRELAKGNAKVAVKDAEACFRQDSQPEHRLLLERAYMGRAEQLQRLRLSNEAKAILKKLLDLKPTDPEIVERIPRLQVVIGDPGVDAAAVLEKEPGLLTTLADQAVLDPRSLAPPNGGIASQVECIREALAAVERGDDNAATEALRELPRHSPLGDWKLLVRGLSAFYLGDVERAGANWQRLDPGRPAFRIAQTLLLADGQSPPNEATIDLTEALAQLRARMQVDPAAAPLKVLAEHWRAGNWRSFFREYRSFRQRFAKSHASLIEKIVELAWKRSVSDVDSEILGRLEAIGPAPALDPRWHRAWAMGFDHPANPSRGSSDDHWQAYIDDLSTIPCLRDEERSIAIGLVHHRLAKSLLQYAAYEDQPPRFPWEERDPEEAARLRGLAARQLRQAIESCPRLTAAYRDLASYHEEQGELQKCAAVFGRLVKIEPDDFDAHLWLANYYLGRNKPNQSEPHVEAVLRLRPRDPQCDALRWNQRLAHVRALVMSRKLADALKQVDAAAEVLDERRDEPFTLDVIRAAVELKGEDHEAFQRHLDAALRGAGEPIAVWMAMSAAAAEYRLPREVKKDFDNRFKSAVKAKPTSRAAGLLAKLLFSMKANGRNYTGRATQERLILKLLSRSGRVEWAEADLKAACRLLETLPKHSGLLAAFAAKGGKRFPGNPHFHYWYASGQLAIGRLRLDYDKLIGHLGRAIELARASDDPADRTIVPKAERALSNVYELQRRWEGAWIERDDDDEDDDEDDDANEDEYGDGDEDDAYGRDGDRDTGRSASGPSDSQMTLFGQGEEESEEGESASGEFEKMLEGIEKFLPPIVLEAARRILEKMG